MTGIRRDRMRRTIGSIVVLAAVGTAPMPSRQADSPVDVIRTRNETVQARLRAAGDSITPEVRERLKDVINSFIDFRELSRRALGKYWNERTAQEREDFVRVFQQLIRNSSVKKLEIYQADRVDYEETERDGDRSTVTTTAWKGRDSAEIVYKLHRVNGAWKVYDVIIDGASTVRSYRDSFYREIARSSYQAMYDKLVKRLNEGT